MPEGVNATALFWSVLGLVFGGGSLGLVLWWALLHKLGESFERTKKDDPVIRESDIGDLAQAVELEQSREQFKNDINGIGSKVTANTTLIVQTRDHVDDNMEPRLSKLEAANEYGWVPLSKQFEELRKGLEKRDREIAEILGNMKGSFDTFVREHRHKEK